MSIRRLKKNTKITPDKKKFWVKQLDVKIHPSEECVGKYTRKATMDILLRFHGLKNIGITGKAQKVQQLVFEMKEPTGEATYDADLDPMLNKWIESPRFEFRRDDRYYVIRDATKTKAIHYELTQDQVELLKENTTLANDLLKQNVKLSSNESQQFVLPQEFSEEMRIMFNAEEVKMKLVNGKIKLSHHPVKGRLEWTE